MEKSNIATAPSTRRPLNGTGVLRISGWKTLRIGTWNVRSLKQDGKLPNVIKEIKRLHVDILGISDTKWPDQGTNFVSDDYVLYYSGGDQRLERYGVGILLTKEISKSVINFVPLSNRAMLITLEAKPFNINIVQVYAPTGDKPVGQIEDLYRAIDTLLKSTKNHELVIVMGDMNAKVGSTITPGVTGAYGLGNRNDRGDTLIEFCQDNNLIIANTFFKLPPRRLYTWTSPMHTVDRVVRNQIDYVMINRRYRNCIKKAQTYPGADIGSDHNPVVVDVACKLKKLQPKRMDGRPNVRKLAEPDTRAKTHTAINQWANDRRTETTASDLDTWTSLKRSVKDICHNTSNHHNWVKKEDWMTDSILQLMEDRRQFKGTNPVMYKQIDVTIRKEIAKAKNDYYSNKCAHLEDLLRKHDSFNAHKHIKEMVGHRRKSMNTLTDAGGNLILDTDGKKRVWCDYVAEMFADSSRNISPITDRTGPAMLRSEVLRALKAAKTGKLPGPDNIPIEILKLLEEDQLDVLTQFFNNIYETGNLPSDWLKSTFIKIPKKQNAKKCGEYRMISLMSHVLKVFLNIIQNRIRPKCDEQLGDSQFGFRSGVSTREALFALNVLVQKCRDMQTDVFLCFIDYEKAFDRVKHHQLFSLLCDIGLDGKDVRIIRNLYEKQVATIRVENEETDQVEICRAVRQGCVLSPLLFNIYSEAVMSKALENLEVGIGINGRVVNNLRYADDTILIAASEADLQAIVNKVNECSEEAGLSINISKTKFMVVSRNPDLSSSVSVAGKQLERVRQYKYLGAWVNEAWESDQEIKTRIETARASFNKMRKVLCCRQLNIKLRVRLLMCYIWPIVMYGCETWTLKEDTTRRLQAFEMWCYRRMLRIGWTQRVRNETVLQRVHMSRKMLPAIKKRKIEYLGHVLRNDRYMLLQLIIMGKVDGKRRAGRRKKSWLRNIREWTGIASVEQLFRLAADKNEYRKLTANLQD
uniref:Endonuclease-reverse transcriptase n=1 Tax=Bombyx mori TaxID=7091 RepID=D5LB38_BOMMO|nr:endonuclease-reverse transcriptase [Bombyx mori]